MKRERWVLLLAAGFFCLIVFQFGCQKLENGPHVDPVTLYEKVHGTWAINDIVQIDEAAKTAGITPDEMSLIGQFKFDTFSLQLNVDDHNGPTDYEVSGESPELFPKRGYWNINTSFPFADGKAPTINLYADPNKTDLTAQLRIVSIPGTKSEMELKLTRSSAGVAFVSYNYKLSTVKQ